MDNYIARLAITKYLDVYSIGWESPVYNIDPFVSGSIKDIAKKTILLYSKLSSKNMGSIFGCFLIYSKPEINCVLEKDTVIGPGVDIDFFMTSFNEELQSLQKLLIFS
jgi:hypothetical protein